MLHFHSEKGLNPFLFKPVYGKFHWDIPFATRTEMTHSKSSMWSFEPFFPPCHSPENIKSYFSFPHRRGNPLNDDRERNSITLSYDTILLSCRRFPGQRIKPGFQQVDGAEGHRQPNTEATCKGNTGSHSKLSHLWSLLISQGLNLWLL